uniref:(California timema) hypothetical protein n=1 Tax=Timema californicum TaxID=61474 RepID=A0A7R9PD16_TIMCA|nr:unnamed protein product [Timema californicum]
MVFNYITSSNKEPLIPYSKKEPSGHGVLGVVLTAALPRRILSDFLITLVFLKSLRLVILVQETMFFLYPYDIASIRSLELQINLQDMSDEQGRKCQQQRGMRMTVDGVTAISGYGLRQTWLRTTDVVSQQKAAPLEPPSRGPALMMKRLKKEKKYR